MIPEFSPLFDSVVDRRGSMSYKWDTTPEGTVPMWVADMDFKTAPCIIEALLKRVEHGVFGYTKVPEEYYSATCRWFERRHGWTIDPARIIYTSGVVPAVSAIIKALANEGDEVVTLTPAYNCFFSSIRNNGCKVVECALDYHVDGSYSINFDLLAKQLASPQAKIFILCNPHNPSGRVWTREELLRIGQLALENGVTVLSDEIHCELTYAGHDYIPFASLGEEFARNSVVCVSPSKAFNIAGLQIANIVCGNESMQRKIDRAININEVCDVNPFGVTATIEAYENGEEWLNALRAYLWDNYRLLLDYFARHAPQFVITPLEGTYLAWVNIESTGLSSDEVEKFLIERAGVRLNAGSMYGEGGKDFLRINLACPRAILREVLPKITKTLKQLGMRSLP